MRLRKRLNQRPTSRSTTMRKLFIPILGGLILLFFAGMWWSHNTSPVNSADTRETVFVIQPGTGISAIAHNLKEQNLIKSPFAFRLLVMKLGFEKKIQAGDFKLSPSMTSEQIVMSLTSGSLDIWVTIPEGKRAEEIAAILEESMPSYDPSWLSELEKNEGFLFPETYLIPRNASIDEIIALMIHTFDEKYNQVNTTGTQLTKQEIVILASMIEREARHDEDRPLISSVMHNRLDIGMALQIDATIQYAKGEINGKWWTPVTLDEYQSVKSPYNTYLQPGLPPGPICNPGLEALQAAANPASTDYLFYITDENGINRYAETVEQHEANKRKYGLSS